jgi:hypothetical protein
MGAMSKVGSEVFLGSVLLEHVHEWATANLVDVHSLGYCSIGSDPSSQA